MIISTPKSSLNFGSGRGYSDLFRVEPGVASGGSQIETCKNSSEIGISDGGSSNSQVNGWENRLQQLELRAMVMTESVYKRLQCNIRAYVARIPFYEFIKLHSAIECRCGGGFL